MKRLTRVSRDLAIRRLLAGSAAARGILERRRRVEDQLRQRERKVWPTATVARLLGISRALLRKWMGQGLLVPHVPSSEHHRSGILARSVRAFLDALERGADSRIEVSSRRRPRPAEARCRAAESQLAEGEEYSPAEFAARAGVSVTTVMRMLANGELVAWYPTPRRPKICHWRHKERKNRLTRKMAKRNGW